MKSRLLLPFLAAVALTSCSTSYKSGQTPDDVYYSPAKETEEYVDIRQNNNNGRYRSYENDNADDRWLRMRVRNPYRWNAFDDYDWNTYNSWSNNFASPYSYSWNNYFNGYYSWNSWYNPYCNNVIILNPKTNPTAFSKVRNFSLNSYTNTNYSNSNTSLARKGSVRLPNSTGGSYNNSNNNNTLGNSLRKVFQGNNGNTYSNSNNNGSYSPSSDRSTRSYTPSSSGSSSSGTTTSGSSGSSSGGTSSGRRGG